MEFIGEGLLYYDALRTDRIGEKVYNHLKKWDNRWVVSIQRTIHPIHSQEDILMENTNS